MAVYNGKYRRKTFVLDKIDSEGASVLGYPKTYSITSSFTVGEVTYPALSNAQFAALGEDDYQVRLAAFYAYVDADNEDCDAEGSVESGYGPTGTDAVGCPIGETAV